VIAAVCLVAPAPAIAQATTNFGDLACAVFLDLPPPAGSATPFLPFPVLLCDGTVLGVTTRNHPLPPPPNTDDPFYTGTFSYSLSGAMKEPIDPAVNPGDFDGRYQNRTTGGTDLLLDFDQPVASFGMSTVQTRSVVTVSDRMRLYDGPLGTGNLVAEVHSQGPPTSPFWHAVRFTGHDAGTPVIRSVVIDVYSDVDGHLFLDGLAFGPAVATQTAAPEIAAAPRLRLGRPYPNPTAGSTSFVLELDAAGAVRVDLLDVSGRRLRTLLRGSQPAGRHSLAWDGRGAGGERLPSGVYFVRLTGAGADETRRVQLVR